MSRPFNSDLVIEEKIAETTFRAYNVGFEENQFRLKPLVDVILNVIPEFALGNHEGPSISLNEMRNKLREAAITVYTTDKYEKRGEFGEIILHLLLRDFCKTIPLISKIYFKDAVNVTCHGFDGVHITVDGAIKKLWLGESKLYTNGQAGVKALAKDLAEHIKADYLRQEFILISRKLPETTPEIEYWKALMHRNQKLESIYNGICIPLVCTYSSDIFSGYSNETDEYIEAFKKECYSLKELFEEHKISTSVDVILMLLPVPDKNELSKELDRGLKRMQSL